MDGHLKHVTRVLVPLYLTLALTVCEPVPAPSFSNPYEKYTNQTIDQLILTTLGGTHPAANQVLDFGENILAELDMFLTKEQFLNMYEPPQPEDMIEMGMMPAPLGTTYDAERKNFYGPAETARHKRRSAARTPSGRSKRKAVRDTTLRWSNNSMPYKFAQGHFDRKEEYMMRRSMTEWERYTCVRFRPSTNTDKNSVHFQNGIGCNSQLGMVGGIQMLNLQAPGCRFKGLYLHEIGHALGLVHEHQLPNRDSHIRILYHNVSPSMRIWFNKYTTTQVDQMTIPYQLSSVMHYGVTAFSKDGKSQTIQALDRNKEKKIGRVYLKELAYTDVDIVNKMYGCADHCTDQTKCGPRGHLNQNCDCICEDGSSDCDRTKGGKNDNCVNRYDSWSCYIWANQGECERNPFYMKQYCSKACRTCGGDSDVTDSDQALLTWPWQWFPSFAQMMPSDWSELGSCKDVHQEATCRIWKGRGDCVTNAGWMKRNCRATCNLCEGHARPEVNCENVHEDSKKCQQWAVKGECKANPNWMFKNCKKSCQLCDSDGPDGGGKDGGEEDEDTMECVNTHKNCEKWAKTNECVDNPDWMINNCRKACNKCDDGKCKNLYDDTKCEIWQQKLECLSNSNWMSRHCAKSCHVGACAKSGDGGSSTGTTKGHNSKTTSRPEVTTSSTCKNRHNSDTQCEMWAKNDHCSINPTWMLTNCAKACDSCSNGPTTSRPRVTTTRTATATTTTASVGKTASAACVDMRPQCATWAKHGYCDNNPRYNLVHCKKSCNNCNGCRDTNALCSVWAEAGHCPKNARYMLRQCQKSCDKTCKT